MYIHILLPLQSFHTQQVAILKNQLAPEFTIDNIHRFHFQEFLRVAVPAGSQVSTVKSQLATQFTVENYFVQ